MNKYPIIASLVMLAIGQSLPAETFLTYGNSGPDAYWSYYNTWRTGSFGSPAATEYYPGYKDETLDFTTATVTFPGGNNANYLNMYVDKNVTIGKLASEWGAFNVTLNMKEQIDQGSTMGDSSLTIKATDSTATAYDFINVGNGMPVTSTQTETSLTFKAGTVNLVGLDSDTATARITAATQSSSTAQLKPISITFDSENTLNSESNLLFSGTTSSSISLGNITSTINLDGTVNARKNIGTEIEPNWQYKQIALADSPNAKETALILNIGGTVNASDFLQGRNNITNLTGTLNLYAAPTSSNSNAPFKLSGGTFNVKNGGIIDANTSTSSMTNPAVWINGFSTLNIENGGVVSSAQAFKTNDWSGQTGATTYVNLQKGGVIQANNFWIGAQTEFNISGQLLATSTTQFYVYSNKTTVNFKEGATADTGMITLAYSTLIIDKNVAKGSWNVKSNTAVRLDNKKSRLDLHSTDVFRYNAKEQKDLYIEATLGDMYLNIYANQNFKSIRFLANAARPDEGVTTGDLHFYIDNSVQFINLATLSEGTLITPTDVSLVTRSIIFHNFRNGVIHVDQLDASDMELISSIDGDWINFRFDENNFLVADYIPEPSTFAAILGALAMGFIIYRKRK